MEARDVGRDFHHPYQPYAIQEQFMHALYDTLESSKVGIFESPTGTGKSLSLICGSLTWLRDHKRRQFEEGLAAGDDTDAEPQWLIEHAQQEKRQEAQRRRSQQEARLAKIRQKEEQAGARYKSGEPPSKRQRLDTDSKVTVEDDEAAFVLADYEGDDEQGSWLSKTSASSDALGLSSRTQAMIDKLGLSTSESRREDEEATEEETKIFFCSRTHSQLSQFVNELRRVKLPPALNDPGDQPAAATPDEDELTENIKHITLGSRKNFCINPKVNRLGSAGAINDRCLELQQTSTSQDARCVYLPKKDNETLVHDFRDHAMARIRDIEDVGKIGKQMGICPYYASRAAISPSEIVTLPYPLLLQKSAREALNISLKDHVVIIDEAHNLMDAIANIHSVSISLEQLRQSRAQLGVYLQKFRNKLKGKNRVYITQLVRLIDSLAGFLEQKLASSTDTGGQVQFTELMTGKGTDQLNLYKLTRYVQESKIARKVDGYVAYDAAESAKQSKITKQQQQPSKSGSSTPVLFQVTSFLETLTNPAPEGRFFYDRLPKDDGKADMLLRYLLLDPTEHFREIVSEARAVILAGGTMSPMDDYINHLFHYLPLERISTLSCGHVIPPSNLLAMPIAKGPSGVDFDFTFEKRGQKQTIEELGLAMLQFAKDVPDGLVAFFPSYAYLDTVVKAWQTSANGSKASIWSQLQASKRIFQEPKSTSTPVTAGQTENQDAAGKSKQPTSKVDQVLQAYTAQIQSSTRTGNGALLLAVIGGSLSEGINFSDRLGRGIVVVGLPFPNARSAEWKARLEFVEQRSRSRGSDSRSSSAMGKVGQGKASQEYLENVCMKAVNQSVGRAIRHKDDYAAIMMLDRRYERSNIQGKLPGWIKESLVAKTGWDSVGPRLKGFFDGKA